MYMNISLCISQSLSNSFPKKLPENLPGGILRDDLTNGGAPAEPQRCCTHSWSDARYERYERYDMNDTVCADT